MQCVYVCICTFQSAVVRLTKQHQEVGTELSNSFLSPSDDNKTLSVVRPILRLIFSAFLFTRFKKKEAFLFTAITSVSCIFLTSQVYPVFEYSSSGKYGTQMQHFSLLSEHMGPSPESYPG